jgi:hypothetical protein
VKVTAKAARRFLVARHFLAPARSHEGGLAAVLEVFRKLGSIQFDPVGCPNTIPLQIAPFEHTTEFVRPTRTRRHFAEVHR